jgi:hypothetical protein
MLNNDNDNDKASKQQSRTFVNIYESKYKYVPLLSNKYVVRDRYEYLLYESRFQSKSFHGQTQNFFICFPLENTIACKPRKAQV